MEMDQNFSSGNLFMVGLGMNLNYFFCIYHGHLIKKISFKKIFLAINSSDIYIMGISRAFCSEIWASMTP